MAVDTGTTGGAGRVLSALACAALLNAAAADRPPSTHRRQRSF
jgi:hypothetical protein